MSMQRMFNVLCEGVDLKGYDCNNLSEASAWYSSDAREGAKKEGWIRYSGHDYCPDCAERKVWKIIDFSRRR